MNNKYKKIVATGLATNMVSINIPYNVFANSNMVEEVILNSDSISLNEYEEVVLNNNTSLNEYEDIELKNNENDKDDLINEKDSINEGLTIDNVEEGVSDYIDSSRPNTADEPISNFAEINEIDDLINGTNNSQETKKVSKSITSITNYANSFAGGNGSKESPYQISNPRELARLAYLVNEEDLDTTNMYFELTDDVDLEGFDADNDNSNGNWIPIGYNGNSFNGLFDGNNYTISNLGINSNFSNNGLFGIVSNATFNNLNLNNIVINAVGNIGALIGKVNNSVNIKNVNISDLDVSYTDTSTRTCVGGIIGFTSGPANSAVIISDSKVGNESNLETILVPQSLNSNTGGIIGCAQNNIDITKSKVYSNILNGGYSTSSGGFVGKFGSDNSNLNIENSEFKGDISGYITGGVIGHIVGNNSDININNFIKYGDINGTYYTGGIVGSLEKGNIDISNADINGNITSTSYDTGGLIGLSVTPDTIDIDSSSFRGNILINNGIAGGLIGSLKNGSIICNITNSIVESDITMNGTYQLGGIVGFNVANTLDISNVEYNGSLESNGSIGGIVGGNLSDVSNVNIIDSTVNAEMFGANNAVGGIVGDNNSILLIDNNSFTGSITANRETGGILGANKYTNSTISNNIVDAILDGYQTGGIVGTSSSGNLTAINNVVEGTINSSLAGGGVLSNSYGSTILIEDNIIHSSITANSYAGGIYGTGSVASIDIINNRVYSDTIKSNMFSGGIYATSSNSRISKNVVNSNIIGNSISGGFIALQEGNIAIDNNMFIGSITGTAKVGGMVGDLRLGSSHTATINNSYVAVTMNGNDTVTKGIVVGDKSNLKGNLELNNVYYDNTLYTEDDNLAVGLTTEQMQGYPTYDNMAFDFEGVWKANKEYYPTFEQLNTAPELSGEDIELIQNQEYDLLDYVTVEDFEDKDLTIEIKETNLDITNIGDYTVTYLVTDPKGLSDELTLNIKVVMESPIINANDLTIYVGDKFDPKEKVTAIDINGNDITEHIKIIENTVNTSKKGIYRVVYQVDSLEKLSTTKEIKVTVLEKENNNADDNNSNNSNGNSNAIEDDKNESSTNDKPQTGDNFVVYGISLLASLVGLFCINRKK